MSVDEAALRAALAKATPGPWEISTNADGLRFVNATKAGRWDTVVNPRGVTYAGDDELIVLLRNNIEDLLDTLHIQAERLARVAACAEAYGYERIPLALDDRPYSAMSPEEMRMRADLSRNSTPAEIAARLRAERRERAERAAARHALTTDDPSFRVDVDAILASIPEDDPGEDPWGGANLERP